LDNKELITDAFLKDDENTLNAFIQYHFQETKSTLGDEQIILTGFNLQRFKLINALIKQKVLEIEIVEKALQGKNPGFPAMQLHAENLSYSHILFATKYFGFSYLLPMLNVGFDKNSTTLEDRKNFIYILQNHKSLLQIIKDTKGWFGSKKQLALGDTPNEVLSLIVEKISPEFECFKCQAFRRVLFDAMQPENYLKITDKDQIQGFGKIYSFLFSKMKEENTLLNK